MHHFAGEVRAMLQRRAADVRAQPPEWHSLDVAQVGLSSPFRGSSTGQRRPGWARPVTAAATVLVIGLVAVVAVDRLGAGSSDTDQGTLASGNDQDSDVWPERPAGAGPEVPAPGSVAFDPGLAAPVHPVTDEDDLVGLSADELTLLTDPVGAARDYLASVGIEEGVGRIAELKVDIATDDDGVRADPDETDLLSVSWSTWEVAAPALTSGHVYLRRSYALPSGEYGGEEDEDREDDPDDLPWIVVGARTDGLRVAGVHRSEGTLVFGIDRSDDGTGIEHLSVEVDGEALAREVPAGHQETLTVHAAADEVAVRLRFQHLDPDPTSVFEMAIPELGDAYTELTELSEQAD